MNESVSPPPRPDACPYGRGLCLSARRASKSRKRGRILTVYGYCSLEPHNLNMNPRVARARQPGSLVPGPALPHCRRAPQNNP